MRCELWFACEQPERPPDAFVLWHYAEDGGCYAGCRLKALAQSRRFPESGSVRWLIGKVGEYVGFV